jgi:hypothetical protein
MLKLIRNVAVAALLLPAAFFGQAKDPLVGTWVLDFPKSDFMNVAPPQNKTITITGVANGFILHFKILNANGATDNWEFKCTYDGMECPMPPDSPLNSVTLRKVDATTVEQIGIMRKKPVETVTYKLSNGGKLLTITTVGKDDDTNNTVQVYDKQ